VNGTRVALALMRPRGHGTIVNVCSGVVFHGLPLMTSYSGAKAAVRAFGQALRIELAFERSRLRVSTVFPPAVNTPFFNHAISHMGWPARPVPPVYQPDVVARGIYMAAMTGRPEMTISGTVAAFALMSRIAPVLTGAVIRRLGVDGHLTRDAAADHADGLRALRRTLCGAWRFRPPGAALEHADGVAPALCPARRLARIGALLSFSAKKRFGLMSACNDSGRIRLGVDK
jgi:hypothetical protein